MLKFLHSDQIFERNALFLFEGQSCQLNYLIKCDLNWITRLARITGWKGNQKINHRITNDSGMNWRYNGRICKAVTGCLDIDLNFSPSTNLLPIRRCNLRIGESRELRTAWLRFPSFSLEPLEQRYTRLKKGLYGYKSGGGRFTSEMTVDSMGLVLTYGNYWSRELA